MRQHSHLEIKPSEPQILFHGTPENAPSFLLTGKLIVHLSEPTRVKALTLKFKGKEDICWSQASPSQAAIYEEHRVLIDHHWNFSDSQRPGEKWSAGKHEFPFELVVPGNLPETLITDFGRIAYKLKAVLERPALHMNLVEIVSIPIKRGPDPGAPWALSLMESIEATGAWEDQLDYRVCVPTRSYRDGEMLEGHFEFQPRAKGIRLMLVGVLLKEYIRYYTSGSIESKKVGKVVARNERALYTFQSGPGSSSNAPEPGTELFDRKSVYATLNIPNCYTGVQYDMMTDLVEVRHRLKFLIRIKDVHGTTHSIYIAVPVSISPVPARDDSTILPRYETAISGSDLPLIASSDGPQAPPPSYQTVIEQDDIVARANESMHPHSWFRETTVPASAENTPMHSPRLEGISGQGSPALQQIGANGSPIQLNSIPPSYFQFAPRVYQAASRTAPTTPQEVGYTAHPLNHGLVLDPEGTQMNRRLSVSDLTLPPIAEQAAPPQVSPQDPQGASHPPLFVPQARPATSASTANSLSLLPSRNGGGSNVKSSRNKSNRNSYISFHKISKSLQLHHLQQKESRRNTVSTNDSAHTRASPNQSPSYNPRHSFIQSALTRLFHPHHHSHADNGHKGVPNEATERSLGKQPSIQPGHLSSPNSSGTTSNRSSYQNVSSSGSSILQINQAPPSSSRTTTSFSDPTAQHGKLKANPATLLAHSEPSTKSSNSNQILSTF